MSEHEGWCFRIENSLSGCAENLVDAPLVRSDGHPALIGSGCRRAVVECGSCRLGALRLAQFEPGQQSGLEYQGEDEAES